MKIEELIEMLNTLKSNGIQYVFLEELSFFNNIKFERCPYYFKNCVVMTKK